MSGDLVSFVLKRVTERGGSPLASTLPELQAQWVCESRPAMDYIVISGGRFDEILTILRQALGEPDRCLGSFPTLSVGASDRRQAIYSVNRIGVGLILAGDSEATLISIVGTQKHDDAA